MIFFFHEMLDEIGLLKRIQHFVQHRKFRMVDEMLNPFRSVLTLQKPLSLWYFINHELTVFRL